MGYLIYQQSTEGFVPIPDVPDWGFELYPVLPYNRHRVDRPVQVDGFEPIVLPDWGYELHPTLPNKLKERLNRGQVVIEGFEPIVPPDWGYELHPTLPNKLRERLNRGQVVIEGFEPIVLPDWGYELYPTLPNKLRANRFFIEVTEYYQESTPATVPDWGYEGLITTPYKLKRIIREQLVEGFVPILNPPVVVPDFVQTVIIRPVLRRKLNRGRVVVTDITEEILVLPGSDRLDGQYLVQYPVPYTGQVVQRGQYIGTYNPSSNTMVLSPTIVYFIPLVITYPIVIDQLGVYVTVPQSGKFCRIGVYRSELGIPGDKIADTGNIVVGTAGERTGAVSVRLSEGVYLFALGTDAATLEVRASDVRTSVLPELNLSSTAINSFYSETHSSGFKEFNTTPTTLTLTSGSVPRIFARRQL